MPETHEPDSGASEVRKLWIEGPAGRLECALRVARGARAAAVVAHPHPLHGGTLHNPVIFHADRELHRAGWTTLRFNFRGVGSSEGEHDGGRGEVGDVAAAVSWLRGVAGGRPLVAVGFSFGSLCCIRHALDDATVAAVVAIGLPVRRYPIEGVRRLGRPFGVVQAEHDEFGTPDDVRPLLAEARPEGKLWVVEDTSHLFPRRAPDAAAAVVESASTLLADAGHPVRAPA